MRAEAGPFICSKVGCLFMICHSENSSDLLLRQVTCQMVPGVLKLESHFHFMDL